MGITQAVLIRIAAAVATLLATTFFGLLPAAHGKTKPVAAHHTLSPLPVDDATVVLTFGDALEELHDAVAFEPAAIDPARVRRACDAVLAQYPQLKDAVGDGGVDLLVAAESMVDACREGFAGSLGDGGFEIVDGDYYTFRELSLALEPQ